MPPYKENFFINNIRYQATILWREESGRNKIYLYLRKRLNLNMRTITNLSTKKVINVSQNCQMNAAELKA